MSESVRNMFAAIAPRYDVSNTALSFGVHHLWRNKTVKLSGAKTGMSVLDCATGTGDLALRFKKMVGKSGSVLGTDFCAEMLEVAPDKAKRKGLEVKFEIADAMNLQYADNSFDIASISFGIRNVDLPVQCLREMARVVKPGGKVVVLEFGQPQGWFAFPYTLYSRWVIPILGRLVTGNTEAYTYLPETAAAFPCGEKFLDLLRETGKFSKMEWFPLTFGISYLYIGTKKQ